MLETSEVLLALDLDPAPEGDVVFNIVGGCLGGRVIPGGVFVFLPINLDGVVAGRAFPGAGGMMIAFLEIFTLNGVGGEIMIAFNYDGVIAFS